MAYLNFYLKLFVWLVIGLAIPLVAIDYTGLEDFAYSSSLLRLLSLSGLLCVTIGTIHLVCGGSPTAGPIWRPGMSPQRREVSSSLPLAAVAAVMRERKEIASLTVDAAGGTIYASAGASLMSWGERIAVRELAVSGESHTYLLEIRSMNWVQLADFGHGRRILDGITVGLG